MPPGKIRVLTTIKPVVYFWYAAAAQQQCSAIAERPRCKVH